MTKIIKVIFSPEAEEVYTCLNKQAPDSKKEDMILRAIHHRIALIKTNIHYGNPIAKRMIPKEYKKKNRDYCLCS